MKRRYRLVKRTTISGYIDYSIERKLLFFWDHVYGHWDKPKVLQVLADLRAGKPQETREVIG